ncbi:MAG: hypothetical protein EXQ55_02555 [Acidobacteria bacterium]|nr:hypothetical protein [Acidobacteriota bacterium]
MFKLELSSAGLALCVLCAPHTTAAQSVNANRTRAAESAPAPIAPETISRTAEGAVTVRAVRIPEGLKLDGRLDESYYRDIPSIGGFIQQDPAEGQPATERTEAWIFFDDTNIYVSARCWDSHPEREIANEMRRDGNNVFQNENFTVIFDTFNDKRNGVFFQTNSLGALRDVAVTDETTQNMDWNAVWDVKTQRTD